MPLKSLPSARGGPEKWTQQHSRRPRQRGEINSWIKLCVGLFLLLPNTRVNAKAKKMHNKDVLIWHLLREDEGSGDWTSAKCASIPPPLSFLHLPQSNLDDVEAPINGSSEGVRASQVVLIRAVVHVKTFCATKSFASGLSRSTFSFSCIIFSASLHNVGFLAPTEHERQRNNWFDSTIQMDASLLVAMHPGRHEVTAQAISTSGFWAPREKDEGRLFFFCCFFLPHTCLQAGGIPLLLLKYKSHNLSKYEMS